MNDYQIEFVQVGDTPMIRLSRPDGQVRTQPAAMTIATIAELIVTTEALRKQLQRELEDARHAVKRAIGAGANAAQHRSTVTGVEVEVDCISQTIEHLHDLADQVRAQAIEAIAAPIRAQFQAAIDQAVASLPTIPQEFA